MSRCAGTVGVGFVGSTNPRNATRHKTFWRRLRRILIRFVRGRALAEEVNRVSRLRTGAGSWPSVGTDGWCLRRDRKRQSKGAPGQGSSSCNMQCGGSATALIGELTDASGDGLAKLSGGESPRYRPGPSQRELAGPRNGAHTKANVEVMLQMTSRTREAVPRGLPPERVRASR
jgi:hypothetical protein